MALAASSSFASFDLTNSNQLSLSDVLMAVLLTDTALLGKVPFRGEVTDTTHYWTEQALAASTVTAAEAMDTTETTMDVTTGQGSRVRIGSLLKDTAPGKYEVMQVTLVTTDALTVVRGYGSSSGETHADAAVYRIWNQAQEGGDAPAQNSSNRTRRSNLTHIFTNTADVSGSLQAIIHAGVTDELKNQIYLKTLELKRELGIALYHSVVSADAGSDTSYRSLQGIKEWCETSGGNITTTAEILNEKVINDLNKLIFDDGGSPSILACNAVQFRKIGAIYGTQIRTVPSDRVRGTFVSSFMTDLGNELELVLDRWMPDDEIVLLEPDRLSLMPLRGRNWFIQDLAINGDAKRKQLIGEFTLEFRNPTEAHGIHSSLTV